MGVTRCDILKHLINWYEDIIIANIKVENIQMNYLI